MPHSMSKEQPGSQDLDKQKKEQGTKAHATFGIALNGPTQPEKRNQWIPIAKFGKVVSLFFKTICGQNQYTLHSKSSRLSSKTTGDQNYQPLALIGKTYLHSWHFQP